MKNFLSFSTKTPVQSLVVKFTLSAILILSAVFLVSAQGGNTSPIDVTEFNFTPTSINTTNSSQNITVTIRVTNTGTGLPIPINPYIYVNFKSPTANQFVYVYMNSQNRISGNGNDGVYQKTISVPQYSEAGIWKVNIYITDSVNTRFFSYAQLAARGFATELQVISDNQDLIPPQISDFSFTPTDIDTTNGSQNVTITIRATDAIAGVHTISVGFVHPTYYDDEGYNYSFGISFNSQNRISGDDKDGFYRAVLTFPQNTLSGIFGAYVDAWDGLNYTRLSPADLNARGYPAQLRITSAATARRTTPFDFDGDGRADVSVFRPSNGTWYLNQSTNGLTGMTFGFGTDKLVPADYDSDGKTDVAVFRPENGVWYRLLSAVGNSYTSGQFGANGDIPVPADYAGDGTSDVALFRPSNGTWYILNYFNELTAVQFGQNGDIPVAADYDGDGIADIAVYRNGIWYLQRSRLGFFAITFGQPGDKPVPADYDGDWRTDIAVFRPSNGTWYLLQSTAGLKGVQFGLGTDSPVPADYDGDGRTDVAVYREGIWYLNRSQAGFQAVPFGAASDKPVPAAFNGGN